MTVVALSPADAHQLPERLALAAPQSRFELAPGRYRLPLLVTRTELTVVGADPAATVLELQEAWAVDQGALTLEGVTVQGGRGTWGGGISVHNGSALALERCIISRNHAARIGGGVHLGPGTATITRCLFSGNRAPAGAALSVHSRSSAIVDRCLFLDNEAKVGGALMINASAQVLVKSCTFLGNRATLGQGEGEEQADGGAAVALLGTSHFGPEVQLINCLFGDPRPLANPPDKPGLLRVASCLLPPGSLEQLKYSDGRDNLQAQAIWSTKESLPLLAPSSAGHAMADITEIAADALDYLGRPLVVSGDADPGALGLLTPEDSR